MSTFTKDPNAVLDYQINWNTWLDGDTIISSTWLADQTGITIDSDSNTTIVATVWLSSGTAGKTYVLTNTITTAAGRTDRRSINIAVDDK